MNRKEILEKFRQTIYYWIIFIVTCVVLIFLPMIGTEVGIGFKIPTTVAGWAIYIASKVLVGVLNVVIFFSFMQQAKINVKDDPKYKEACEILAKEKRDKQYIPRNPKVWERKQYLSKGFTTFLSTVVGLVALTNAILTYDYMSLLAYSIAIIIAIVFGLLAMTSAEEYWTVEFWDYAQMIKLEAEIAATIVQEEKEDKLRQEEEKTIVEEIIEQGD